MHSLLQDLRYGARLLLKSPGFAAAAILTLALGIGATTAIFSVVNRALLNPLPYPEPDRIVALHETLPLFSPKPISMPAPDFVDYRNQSHSFSAMAAYQEAEYELSGTHESERVAAARASASLLQVLQVAPLRGRWFAEQEDKPDELVCVISYGLWQRWFGADPNVVGETVAFSRKSYRIVGVMPRGFAFPLPGAVEFTSRVELWVPMALTKEELEARGDNYDYSVVARLKPGVSRAQAEADLNVIARQILNLFPPQFKDKLKFTASAIPLAAEITGNVRPLLLALIGAVGFVLLIACANVSNLLLARAARRQREMAVRVALGAGRGRLIRQLVAETLVLATCGAALGLALAWWTTDTVVRFTPSRFSLLTQARIDVPVLLFTIAVAVLTAVVVGTVPGFVATATNVHGGLKEAGRTGMQGVRHNRLRSALVVTEITLALVLLVGAGLLIRSFQRLLVTNPGFQPEGAVAASLSLPSVQYRDVVQIRGFYRDLVERLRQAPNVDYAAATNTLPLTGNHWTRTFTAADYRPPPNAGFDLSSHSITLGSYFQAAGIGLVRGRYFTPNDTKDAPPVVIVSQSLAQHFWSGKDPIGERLKLAPAPDSTRPWCTVVGVVDDVKTSLASAPLFQTYQPYAQLEDDAASHFHSLSVVVRGRAATGVLISEVREAVHSLDPRLAIADLQPMTVTFSESASPQRFNMLLMGGFAAVSLLLAAIGIYGVIAYSVTQRTHEIGVRMALGASTGNVLGMVLRAGLLLAGLGIALGSVAAMVLAPLLKSLLYGVRPLDATTFVAVAAGLAAVALLASYIPARRATKVDPMVALRYE